ncbi:hypothetical protein [Thermococcus sp.]
MKLVTVYGGGFFSGKAKRLIEDTITNLEVLENSVVFREPIEAEFGIFKAASSVLLGPKVGARGSRYYTSGWLFNTSRKFTPSERVNGTELRIEPRRYRIEIDVPGSGLMEFPGYRLKNGVLLLYITPRYDFSFPSDVLSAGGLEDYAQLSIKPLENGFEGELAVNLIKAEYVSLDVVGELVGDQIFFGSEPGKVKYEFLSTEVLIVSYEKVLDVPKLQKVLGLVSIVSGHGDFTLKLEVGKAREEMRFSVFLPEG